MKSYAFELVKHTLSEGKPFKTLTLAWRIGRCKMARQHRLVYSLSAAGLDRVPVVEIPGYEVEGISSWETVGSSLRREFEKHKQLIYWDVQGFLEQGGKIWLGRLEGRLANLGGTRTGDRMDFYFFPLIPKSAVFSHFVTFPDFRGKNLFQAMMGKILLTLAGQGVEQFYIDCTDWNIPSIRGIERTGFQLIGHGQAGRSGKLVWFQTSKPCV
jgi:hypothetical protein